ncbi:MAG: class I SAM-dependent rRNA methyltransferase [Saprospirales bacterium]|nr:MAG: class I SAM-dependent rRNA methyltransferase [Saprospirales bacterium]
MTEIILKNSRLKTLNTFHPWIFSGAIKVQKTVPQNGELVRLISEKDDFLAIGHYQSSSIAIRILSFEDEKVDEQFYIKRLQKAFDRRAELLLNNSGDLNCFRWVNGEGDDLPGLIADYYNGLLVVQFHSDGMCLQRECLLKAFLSVNSAMVQSVYFSFPGLRSGASDLTPGLVYGERIEFEVVENGIKYIIDPAKGQKTGFFLDQRDNRMLIAQLSKGKKVLNAFSYTGGFSISALKGGAIHVDSVDVSSYAADLCREHTIMNGLDEERHRIQKEDVYQFLSSSDQLYDLIVLDPPAFAKSRAKSHNAVQAYKRLNMMGLNRLREGGLLLTFSCSQVIDKKLFEDTIRAAAIESKRPLKILKHLGPGPDHPVNIFHREGHYLKGFLLQT